MIKFKDLPDTDTPINAENLNANFEEAKYGYSYSTQEQKIGTWLGKPLYRKTISFTPEENLALPLDMHNIDEMWIDESHSFITNNAETLTLNQYSSEGYTRSWINKQNKFFRFITSWDLSDRTGYVTLKYTKTTD